ncbi:MAG: hypothetical protein ACR2N3_05615 [Pyrinomonadaceae bacterium]
MNSKFCGRCGATNADQTKFCSQCGENLEIAAPPASNYAQPPAFSPNQFQPPPSFAPSANNFSTAQSGFSQSPPSFVAPDNFAPPNVGFQPPPFQQSPQFQQSPLASTVASQKTGIGSKIASALGMLIVGFILFIKFGFILFRAGSFGGIWLVGIVFVVIVVIAIFNFARRGRS